jgi:hypothetical protein
MQSQKIVGLDVAGFLQTIQELQNMGKKVKPILRRAANTSSTPIVQAMKSMLNTRGKRSIYNGKKVFTYGQTGLLKKVIGARVMTRRSSVFADVGPRYAMGGFAFKKWHKPTKSAKGVTSSMVMVNPVYYGHLVNNGFTAKLFGTGRTKRVMGIDFIGKAYASAKSQVVFTTTRILNEEFDKALNS